MAAKKETKLNVSLSAEIRERVASDAAAQEVSLNDVFVRILADHFSVKFEGTGRRSPGVHKLESGTVILRRVPEQLDEKIYRAASRDRRQHRARRTKSAVVESILRAHYELEAVAA